MTKAAPTPRARQIARTDGRHHNAGCDRIGHGLGIGRETARKDVGMR